MKKPIEVKEFQSIIYDSDYADIADYKCIEKKQFEDLVTFVREYTSVDEGNEAYDFMRYSRKKHVDAVTFRNYVGLIQMKDGFQVQILPKIDFITEDDEGNEETKKLFLKMLRSMKDLRGKVFNEAAIKADKMNLYEIFINMYVQEVLHLVKHGLRSDYVIQEDNLGFYKGKLLVGKHIRLNSVHKERFYVGFEEYLPNRPENKLVKATLEKLLRITTSAENSKEIRQLLMAFEMVETSISYEKDFAKVVINRNTKDYENLIRWSRVFLMNESFSVFSGSTTSRALLFPMESVYESYVSREIKKSLIPHGWDVSCQEKGMHLFKKPKKLFRLRPDIVLRRGGRTVIMDTKWKKLSLNETNYGISQSDMYQMYAYSKKYKTPEIWLLYPDNREMKGRTDIIFDSGDGTRVRVWFVDLKNIQTDIQRIEEILETQI